MYRLGYCETIVSIILAYHKAIILCFFTINAWNIITMNKYEYLFHIIFSFLMSSVSNTDNIYSVLFLMFIYLFGCTGS